MDRTARLRQMLREEMDKGAGIGGRGFSPVVRQSVAKEVRGRRLRGESDMRIAGALGLSTQTLRRWAGVRCKEMPSFRRVAVVQETAAKERKGRPAELVLWGPRGLRIEGVSIEQAVEVWRRLS